MSTDALDTPSSQAPNPAAAGIDDWLDDKARHSRSDARAIASLVMVPVIADAALRACQGELSLRDQGAVSRRIGVGVREAFAQLTMSWTRNKEQARAYWFDFQKTLTSPATTPAAARLLPWPDSDLRALRWTAMLISHHVGEALSAMRDRFASPDAFERLRASISNTAYQLLNDHPDLAGVLARDPAWLIPGENFGVAVPVQ